MLSLMLSLGCVSVIFEDDTGTADQPNPLLGDSAVTTTGVLAHDDADNPTVTTGHIIPPLLRAQMEAAHNNSVSGHFGVDYTHRVLLHKGASDEGLRRYVAKFVRECPVRPSA
jgi:hypothetical protein